MMEETHHFVDGITKVIDHFEAAGKRVIAFTDPSKPLVWLRQFKVPFERLVELERLIKKQKENGEAICLARHSPHWQTRLHQRSGVGAVEVEGEDGGDALDGRRGRDVTEHVARHRKCTLTHLAESLICPGR